MNNCEILQYLHFTLAHSKGQGQGRAHLTLNTSKMVTYQANITIDIKY